MRATGIVRRLDDLGRVIIPREIRKILNIREGSPLEFFIENKSIVLRRYEEDTINDHIEILKTFVQEHPEQLKDDKISELNMLISNIEDLLDN